MNKFFLSSFAVFILFACVSCKRYIVTGNGKEVTDTRTIAGFDKIEISAPVNADITVKTGSSYSLQLTGYQNIVEHIKAEVEGNALSIFTPQDIDLITGNNVKAIITVPSLSAISLSGAQNAHIIGNVTGNDFDLDISGAGDLVIDDLNVTKFTTSLSGVGGVKVNNGVVQHAEYSISGAGKIDAFALQTTETVASISGTGGGNLNVQKELNAHISGAGSIRYKGHPVVSSQISGVGEVADAN